MSEDANGWERPSSRDYSGSKALRRAAGGPPPWRHSRPSRELPPVVDQRKAHRREDSTQDAVDRREGS